MDQQTPFLVKRKLICENSRFSVFFDELECQGRPSAVDYLIVAPKLSTENLVTGVAVLPICDGKVGLIKAYRHAIQGDSWEIPRGFLEEGETDAGCALRELREETGLSCELVTIQSLGFVTPDAGILAARIHLFVARACIISAPYVPGEFGHKDFQLFDRPTVKEMILHSEIQDPCTLISYYNYVQI